MIETLLQNKPELPATPQIYAWSHSGIASAFNFAAHILRPENVYSAGAHKLAKRLIMPLVSANEKPLPLEESRNRLKNLTLLCYSAGTVLVQEIFIASLKQMQAVGYTEKNAQELLQEVVLIGIGGILPPSKLQNRFTAVHITAHNDIIARLLQRKNLTKSAKALTIDFLSTTAAHITASIREKMWECKETPQGWRQKEDITPILPNWLPPSGHELQHYITTDDGHNEFSKIVLHSLINAVTRSAKLSIQHIFNPASIHPSPESKSYRKRVRQAINRAAKDFCN